MRYWICIFHPSWPERARVIAANVGLPCLINVVIGSCASKSDQNSGAYGIKSLFFIVQLFPLRTFWVASLVHPLAVPAF